MNSILLSKLPQTLKIGGVEVGINTDFRTFLQYEKILSDNKLEDNEKINKILDLVYPVLRETTDNSSQEQIILYKHVLENIKESIDKIQWFYRCGKDIEDNKETDSKVLKEIYSFEHDSEAIISDFKREYNINLSEEDLHWWTFKTYFNGLKEDSELKQRMRFRTIDIAKVPKEQQEYYRKMKKIYEIPHDKEEVKKNSELASIFM